MLRTIKASVTSLSEGMQVQSESRSFRILMDEPKAMGGSDQGMNPLEVLLGALGGCQAIVAKMFAKAQGVTFEEFHLEIEADIDMSGMMGNADARNGFQEIRYNMHFKTDESQETMERFAKFIEQTCPVTDTLLQGTNMVLGSVVLNS